MDSFISLLGQVQIFNSQMRDYQGGDNPALAVVFIVLVIFLVLCGVVYLIWEGVKILRFNKICAASKLTGEEIGFLRTFISRLHIKQPLNILLSKGRYDSFMNKIAHFYEDENISEEDLMHEIAIFNRIRTKLSFNHRFRSRRLTSSRALPLNYPINITHFDRDTKEIITFKSRVLQNDDFYVGISPPEKEWDTETFNTNGKKPVLEVSFRRPKENEYLYDSCLVRMVSYPKTMWFIRHSDFLIKGDPMKNLEIPANILITHKAEKTEQDQLCPYEEGMDYPVNLISLNNKECLFNFEDDSKPLLGQHKILLSFELNKTALTVRAQITQSIKKNDRTNYHCLFKDLSQEDFATITNFVIAKKSAKVKKPSKA